MKTIMITGVSGSGKTTIQKELAKLGWHSPINFTTRKPRGEYELDDYVFLTREQFFTKLENGDFIDYTHYGGNWYAMSKEIPKDKNICYVVDPVGREQISNYLQGQGIKFTRYFISISKSLQKTRLINRGDKIDDIEKRRKDFKWFFPTRICRVLDGETPIERILKTILNNPS